MGLAGRPEAMRAGTTASRKPLFDPHVLADGYDPDLADFADPALPQGIDASAACIASIS